MKTIKLKTYFCLTIITSFLALALLTDDAVQSQIFASLAILTGAYSSYLFSIKT